MRGLYGPACLAEARKRDRLRPTKRESAKAGPLRSQEFAVHDVGLQTGRRMVIRTHVFAISLAISLAILVSAVSSRTAAQGSAALTGVVSSQAEGAMEGVLVSAKRAGLDDDDDGCQRCAGPLRLSGQPARSRARYTVRIRATGYDLEGPVERGCRRRPHGAARSEAAQDAGPRRAADQRRMVHELARHDGDEERPAQLHAVPHARARRAQQAHRRSSGRRSSSGWDATRRAARRSVRSCGRTNMAAA